LIITLLFPYLDVASMRIGDMLVCNRKSVACTSVRGHGAVGQIDATLSLHVLVGAKLPVDARARARYG